MGISYFGTDGIRGRANTFPLTAEVTLKVGMAAGMFFRKTSNNQHRVVIGKDTRRSGYMLENALTAGLTATGMNVHLLGPIPTPAIGLLTKSMRADLGVMITASHNGFQDNGMKFFGPDGFKLSMESEKQIEKLIDTDLPLELPENIGRAERIDGGLGRYIEFAKTTFPKNLRLNGLRIVIDCANGAGYKVAPEILWELGAEVVPIGVSPNGFNINQNCGSTDPALLIEKIKETRADVGLALDGDGDRILVCDERGREIDGDQLLALFATRLADTGQLLNNTVVATKMSNLGLQKYLEEKGITLIKASVGDRNISKEMRTGGFSLGGENSGHIIISKYSTTGDGIIAALQFLSALVETGKKASEVANVFKPVPQILRNVRIYKDGDPTKNEKVQQIISNNVEKLNGKGQVFVRKSGTEPVVRVLVTGECINSITEIANEIENAVLMAA
ncbi:MAG: phosphoglucosamine mutase [Rhodobacteraceae bacterium]|nr:phosphoglucosamine mutase [Paracoccaceae bacterium]MDE2760107.1 phosphoglucosamine mutase [Paracoccaceae bacterium]MDE2916442.1 phosphoglucosamine mutase [Paracoccaceae bacterium]MYE37025.1 phosphoglucosamine mutase [Paracoccaceae bacterium]MYG42227.1 phosphoglucosamine mutase [Paracoccaceae bacterium]